MYFKYSIFCKVTILQTYLLSLGLCRIIFIYLYLFLFDPLSGTHIKAELNVWRSRCVQYHTILIFIICEYWITQIKIKTLKCCNYHEKPTFASSYIDPLTEACTRTRTKRAAKASKMETRTNPRMARGLDVVTARYKRHIRHLRLRRGSTLGNERLPR